MLHHVFITLTTEAFVASFYVDAMASAVAARFCLTFVIIWTTGKKSEEQYNVYT